MKDGERVLFFLKDLLFVEWLKFTQPKRKEKWTERERMGGQRVREAVSCVGSGLSAADSSSAGQWHGQGGASGAVCNFGVMSLSFCDL